MQNKSFLNLVPCQKTKPLGTGGVFEQRDMHWKTEQYRPFLQLVLVFELFGFIPLMVYSIPLFLFKIFTLPIYSIKYVNNSFSKIPIWVQFSRRPIDFWRHSQNLEHLTAPWRLDRLLIKFIKWNIYIYIIEKKLQLLDLNTELSLSSVSWDNFLKWFILCFRQFPCSKSFCKPYIKCLSGNYNIRK